MRRVDRIVCHIAIGAASIAISVQSPDGSQVKALADTAGTLAALTATLETMTRDV